MFLNYFAIYQKLNNTTRYINYTSIKKKIYCPAHYKKTLSNFCLAAEINLTFSQPPQSAIKRPRSESGLDLRKEP